MQVEQTTTPRKNPFIGGKLTLIKGAIASRKSKAENSDVYFETLLHASDGKASYLRTGTCLHAIISSTTQEPEELIFITMINDEDEHTNKIEVLPFKRSDSIINPELNLAKSTVMIERNQIISVESELNEDICSALQIWSEEYNRKEVPLFIKKSSFKRDKIAHKAFMINVMRILFERKKIPITDESLEDAVKYPGKRSTKKGTIEKKRDRSHNNVDKADHKKRKVEIYVDGKLFNDIHILAEHHAINQEEAKKEMQNLQIAMNLEKEKAIKAQQEAEMKVSYYKGIMLGKGWELPL